MAIVNMEFGPATRLQSLQMKWLVHLYICWSVFIVTSMGKQRQRTLGTTAYSFQTLGFLPNKKKLLAVSFSIRGIRHTLVDSVVVFAFYPTDFYQIEFLFDNYGLCTIESVTLSPLHL